MFGELSDIEIEEVLAENYVGRIGCHAVGKTYVVPISYAFDKDCIYAHTFEGLKIEMMRQNTAVCFQVDQMENMANWKSIIAWGNFEEIIDEEERKEAFEKLMNRHLPYLSSDTVKLTPQWPFPPKDTESVDGIIFKICVHKKTGRYESSEGGISNSEFL